MASILVVVFLVEVAVAFVNSIGAETINNLVSREGSLRSTMRWTVHEADRGFCIVI